MMQFIDLNGNMVQIQHITRVTKLYGAENGKEFKVYFSDGRDPFAFWGREHEMTELRDKLVNVLVKYSTFK